VIADLLCRACHCEKGENSSKIVYDLLPDSDLQELYTRYLLEPYELSEPEIQLKDWLEALLKREAKQGKKELEKSLREAEKEGDTARIRTILMEIRDLSAKTCVSDLSDNV
jgi:hypothetical protein